MGHKKAPARVNAWGMADTCMEVTTMENPICLEDGCEKEAKASRGWCWGHYERWRKYGDPQAPVEWYDGETIQEKILKRVDKSSGCWEWTGHISDHGYAAYGGSSGWAHRVSYEAFVGPIPEGLDLDHLCRNRSCVNPDHLEPVTRSENLRRSPLVGHHKRPTRTHCSKGHRLDDDNLYIEPGNGARRCRICLRAKNARAAARRRRKVAGI